MRESETTRRERERAAAQAISREATAAGISDAEIFVDTSFGDPAGAPVVDEDLTALAGFLGDAIQAVVDEPTDFLAAIYPPENRGIFEDAIDAALDAAGVARDDAEARIYFEDNYWSAFLGKAITAASGLLAASARRFF